MTNKKKGFKLLLILQKKKKKTYKDRFMNMKTEFRWLLICIDYDSEECFMKWNEMKWMCEEKEQNKNPRNISK